MNIKLIDPPREFEVGRGGNIRIKDCARIELSADEQVTFVSESGSEYDLTRKSWGYYATPSINGRLLKFGLRALLIKGGDGKYYVFLVEEGKEEELERYLKAEGHRIVCRLDNDKTLEKIEESFKK
jgi:hypothetical protein